MQKIIGAVSGIWDEKVLGSRSGIRIRDEKVLKSGSVIRDKTSRICNTAMIIILP
jgi:hypothetical protein